MIVSPPRTLEKFVSAKSKFKKNNNICALSNLTHHTSHALDEIRGMRYVLQYNNTFTGYKGTIVDPFPTVALPFLRALDRAVCKPGMSFLTLFYTNNI